MVSLRLITYIEYINKKLLGNYEKYVAIAVIRDAVEKRK